AKTLLLAASLLAEAYHRLPSEILAQPAWKMEIDWEALKAMAELRRPESLSEEIRRRRLEAGLQV
ncbi:MAG: hypothetical protein ACXQTV_03575, partial [Candidatus Hecatellaceae archaeon]